MKVFKNFSAFLLIAALLMMLMTGCGQQNTVESFVVSNSPFEEFSNALRDKDKETRHKHKPACQTPNHSHLGRSGKHGNHQP